MQSKSLHRIVRRICLALPETTESDRLGGEPHFYVRGKIFAGCGSEDGRVGVGMKVGRELQAVLITRPGFRVAKYVGKHGWITVDAEGLQDEAELRRLLHLSYELISGRSAAAEPAAAATAKPKRARKVASKARRRE